MGSSPSKVQRYRCYVFVTYLPSVEKVFVFVKTGTDGNIRDDLNVYSKLRLGRNARKRGRM